MPRTARRISSNGVYHVMLRGINGQKIFEDDHDKERFIEILGEYKTICGYEVLAYCLMDDHAHILLRIENEPISTVFRRIAPKYVHWYNTKYDRAGRLFQDRFKSEPVEDDAYLLTVLRYIHRKPVKAGLCAQPDEYAASSYLDYMGRDGITDTGLVLSIMPKDELAAFTAIDSDEKCLDMPANQDKRLTDDSAMEIIKRVSGCDSASAFQELTREQRDACLAEVLHAGVSIRQASRLTGVPFGIVRKFTS